MRGRGTCRRRSLVRTLTPVAAVVLAVALSACDWGPAGQGDWRASVVGPEAPFGSAVVMISGVGLQDVAGEGGARAWTHETHEGELRAVLIQTEATGDLHFRIRVGDMTAPPPTVTVIELADLADRPVTVTEEHRVRLRR